MSPVMRRAASARSDSRRSVASLCVCSEQRAAEKPHIQLVVTQPNRQEIIYKNSISKHLSLLLTVWTFKHEHSSSVNMLSLSLVIDRYWSFISDTDYLYVYVPDNRYAEPIFIYCYKVSEVSPFFALVFPSFSHLNNNKKLLKINIFM